MPSDKKHKSKKKLGSYPSITVIYSVTLALIVIGLLGQVLIHAHVLTDSIKNKLELHVFLNNHISEGELIKLKTIISAKPYVQKKNGRAQLEYISQEEATKRFINENEEDSTFVEALGYNPIRSSYVLKVDQDFSDVSHLKKIKNEIENMHGVFEVDLPKTKEEQVKSINQNIRTATIVLLVFMILSIVTIIVLINNTIKLALFSQRFLIRSMQLVGATSFFIQKPFLSRTSLHGIVSGLIAAILIFSLMQYLYNVIEPLKVLYSPLLFFSVLAILPVLGLLIALLSSFRAVNKYLKLSLDELY